MKPLHKRAFAAEATSMALANARVATRLCAAEIPSSQSAVATTNAGMISMNARLPKLSPNHQVDHVPFATASSPNDASAASAGARESARRSAATQATSDSKYHGWYAKRPWRAENRPPT